MAISAAWLARRRSGARGRTLVLLGPPLVLLVGGLISKQLDQIVVLGPDRLHSVIERFFALADLFSFGVVAVASVLVTTRSTRLPAHRRPAAVALGLLAFIPARRRCTEASRVT